MQANYIIFYHIFIILAFICYCEEETTLLGHSREVKSLAGLDNGGLSSGSDDCTTKIGNKNNGILKMTFNNHPFPVNALVVLNNGDLASAIGNTIKIWNTNNGSPKMNLTGHSRIVWSLAQLKNGDLASGSKDKTIKIWNKKDGSLKKSLKGHTNSVFSLAVLNNGNLASGSEDKTIRIWKNNDGSSLKILRGHSDSVCSLAVLKNGDLASGSWDNSIIIWDTNIGNIKKNLWDHSGRVFSLAVLNNGDLASGSGDKTIKIWNTNNGKEKMTLTGHFKWVESLEVLKNGYLASGSEDKTIKIWNIDKKCEIMTLIGHSGPVFSLAVLKNGDLASGSSYGTIKIWTKINGNVKKILVGKTEKIKEDNNCYFNGSVANQDDCQGYFYCKDNKVKKKQCPHRKLFDEKSKTCKEFKYVFCGNRSLSNEEKDEEDFCSSRPNGTYPTFENGCAEYFKCENSLTVEKSQCPNGLKFNMIFSRCDHESNIPPPCGNFSNEEKDVKDLCSSRLNGTYPNFENGCASFFKCENSLTVEKSHCQNGLKFNMISLKCDNASNIPAPCGTKIALKPSHKTEFKFHILFSLITFSFCLLTSIIVLICLIVLTCQKRI